MLFISISLLTRVCYNLRWNHPLRIRRPSLLFFFFCFLPISQHHPIIHKVILKIFPKEQVFKQPFQITIIRSFFKPELSSIVNKSNKLRGVSLAQSLYISINFPVHNPLVLISLIIPMQALPRQLSFQKIHQYIP